MEQLETAQAEHARLSDRLAAIDARAAELVETRDAGAGDVARQTETLTAERKVTATGRRERLSADIRLCSSADQLLMT